MLSYGRDLRIYRSIVFTESEKGFTVARLKEPKKKELTCIVGIMPSVQPGETIRCKGEWKIHPEYGQQFEVKSFDLSKRRPIWWGFRNILNRG